jgi:hypothetical protein
MKYKTSYEWVAEDCDENGDIIDPAYGDTLAEVMRYHAPADNVSYALVKNIGNQEDGLKSREYAYLKNNYKVTYVAVCGVWAQSLPDEFDDGGIIPLRFHVEVNRQHVILLK